MPRGDGTGPQGQGPLTGRGLGSFGNESRPNGSAAPNQSFGGRIVSGIGRMFGYGQGRRAGQGLRGGRGRNRR